MQVGSLMPFCIFFHLLHIKYYRIEDKSIIWSSKVMQFFLDCLQLLTLIYICRSKLYWKSIFSTVEFKSNLLIEKHYCVMENTTANMVNVVKNALQQLIVAYPPPLKVAWHNWLLWSVFLQHWLCFAVALSITQQYNLIGKLPLKSATENFFPWPIFFQLIFIYIKLQIILESFTKMTLLFDPPKN